MQANAVEFARNFGRYLLNTVIAFNNILMINVFTMSEIISGDFDK